MTPKTISELIREALDILAREAIENPTKENIERLDGLSGCYVRYLNIETHDEMAEMQKTVDTVVHGNQPKEVN